MKYGNFHLKNIIFDYFLCKRNWILNLESATKTSPLELKGCEKQPISKVQPQQEIKMRKSYIIVKHR